MNMLMPCPVYRQSALSRGFHVDSLRELARLYTEHRFITADEADTFMEELPTISDTVDEPQARYRSTFS